MSELSPQIFSPTNLLDAWRRIQKKGAQGGLDGVSVASFAPDAPRHLAELEADLKAGRYTPEPHHRVKVSKMDGTGELRPLSLPTIKDKIVQQAVRQILEPLFEAEFLDCSYAYRPGKGPRRAIGRTIHYLENLKRSWVVHADFDRFFDTLDHDLLLDRLKTKTQEGPLLKLIRMWLKIGSVGASGVYAGSHLGVGQGGIISPLLSNIYTHPLDVYLTDKQYGYIRYADNILLLEETRSRAEAAFADLDYFTREMLKLALNQEAERVRHLAQGFTFLGIFFRGRQRHISEAKMAKIIHKLDNLTHRRRSQPLSQLLADLQESLQGIRRYYSVIHPVTQFAQIETRLSQRLINLLASRYACQEINNQAEAASFLTPMVWLLDHPPPVCQDRANRIAQQARQLWQSEKKTSPAPKPSRLGAPIGAPPSVPPQPHTDSAGTPPSGQASLLPPPSSPESDALSQADQAVARQERRYVRKHALESEVVVTTPGAGVGKQGGRLVVRQNRKTILSLPLIKVRGVTVMTPGVSVSSNLIHALSSQQLPLHFCTPGGQLYASLHAPLSPQADLTRRQLDAAASPAGLLLAREFVEGKIRNQLNLLKFYARSRQADPQDPFTQAYPEIEARFRDCLAHLKVLSLDEAYETLRSRLFALEGQAGAAYWSLIKHLLPPEAAFSGRERRGARDLVNSLLNYGYAILSSRVYRALLLAGLNPHISFLHTFQEGKPTLVFDLIEEFRPQAVDRAVFSMLTRGEALTQEAKTARLTLETRQKVITQILERLGSLTPYRGQKVTLGDIIGRQARLLARHLKGEQRYRHFLGRY